MSMTISNEVTFDHGAASTGHSGSMKRLFRWLTDLRLEYQSAQQVIRRSYYEAHALNHRQVPRRVWQRHSALFLEMSEHQGGRKGIYG